MFGCLLRIKEKEKEKEPSEKDIVTTSRVAHSSKYVELDKRGPYSDLKPFSNADGYTNNPNHTINYTPPTNFARPLFRTYLE